MDGDVSIARIWTQEIGIIRVAAEQRVGAEGNLARILVLFQERGSVRDSVDVQLVQEMPALRSHVGGIQNEVEREPHLDTEIIIHDHRELPVLIQTQQAAGREQGISGIDLVYETVYQRGLESGGRIG